MGTQSQGRCSPLFASLAVAMLVIGCTDRNAGSAQVTSSSDVATTDKWIGRWDGPEGTYLQLVGGNGTYEVTVQNLDGPRTFRGSAAGDRIEFERNGVKESVRATTGVETGMKWLRDNSVCLTVRAGEGYCRD